MWDTPFRLLQAEIVQREYEGYPVPEAIKEQVNALRDAKDFDNETKIAELNLALLELAPDPDFGFEQPDDLEDIRQLRPEGPRKLTMKLDESELLDKLHGAWLGRSCGCALGKPVEILGMMGHGSMNGRLAIKTYLENRNQWPLDFYFSNQETGDGMVLRPGQSFRENISYMEPDDDIHYTLIGLQVLEKKGPDFAWHDVARQWNLSLPYYAICTAETQAIMNFNLKTPRMGGEFIYPTPDFTRRHNNPYREWIGAQIRADGWAYTCAGNPELAAELAWRDAHWTHTANGIYGEMFMAAIIAAAFIESDPRKLVDIGLSEIPRNCKLAEAIHLTLEWIETSQGFEAFMEKLEALHGDMSSVHTVNNAMIVVMSLFYGEMDPDRSICISVMAALDTDCNGATVGSIVGAVRGRKNFGGKLAEPLNDKIKPQVFGFQSVSMAELAERTLAVYKTVGEYALKH